MVETPFRSLAPRDKLDALVIAVNRSKRRAYLLEKDIWVVETLKVLVEAPFGRHLTFKGGTSLAKAWRAVRRFSEDIDIIYDIRAFAPDLMGGAGAEVLPPTRSQEQRWTKAIRARLAAWVRDQALPAVEVGLARDGYTARVRADGERLHVGYDPSFDDYGFVRPEVLVDFGARSTGEPREVRTIDCDAAAFPPDLSFPEARPAVIRRTHLLGESDLHARLLPPATGTGRPAVQALARRRPARRRRRRGGGSRRPCPRPGGGAS